MLKPFVKLLFFVAIFTSLLHSTVVSQEPETTEKVIIIRQSWEQEPAGHDRKVHVRLPREKRQKAPVIIFFHGNGGTAEHAVREWGRQFPNRFVAAPQGYRKSWNIHGEKSKAPDVEFFRKIVSAIGGKYPTADVSDITLIGSSNGAGLIHRFMIEIDAPLFHTAVPLVASLVEQQYRDGSFWLPRKGDTDHYETRKSPKNVPHILYIHGTRDNIVPFGGGLRFKQFRHLSAPETAYRWAQAQQYRGPQLTERDGKTVAPEIIRYAYPGTTVTFLEVKNGTHGLTPHREAVMQLVSEFVRQSRARGHG